MRNVLTQSIGTRDSVSVQQLDLRLKPGDRLLMTSDGVHGVISTQTICEILASGNPPSDITYALILATRDRGAPDNTSSIVVDYHLL